MIVKCDKCQTRFKIPDEKVTDRGVKVRCTKCENTFRVFKTPASGQDGARAAQPDPTHNASFEAQRNLPSEVFNEPTRIGPSPLSHNEPTRIGAPPLSADAFPTRVTRAPVRTSPALMGLPTRRSAADEKPDSAPQLKEKGTPGAAPAADETEDSFASLTFDDPPPASATKSRSRTPEAVEAPPPEASSETDFSFEPPPADREATHPAVDRDSLGRQSNRNDPVLPNAQDEASFGDLDVSFGGQPNGGDASGYGTPENDEAYGSEPSFTGADSEPSFTGADSEPSFTGADSEPSFTGADSEPSFSEMDPSFTPAPTPDDGNGGDEQSFADMGEGDPSFLDGNEDPSFAEMGAAKGDSGFDRSAFGGLDDRKALLEFPHTAEPSEGGRFDAATAPDVPVTAAPVTSKKADVPEPPRRQGAALHLSRVIVNVGLAATVLLVLATAGTMYLNEGRLDATAFSSDKVKALFAAKKGLVAIDVSNGLYETRAGRPVFYIRGEVENRGDVRSRVKVRAEILEGSTLVRAAETHAGATPTPEELNALGSAADLTLLAERLEKGAKELGPADRLPFLVAFYEYPPDLGAFRLNVVVTAEPSTPETVAR